MLVLQSGNYSGHILEVLNADDLIIGRTGYQGASAKSPWHCHENTHISFALQGGCLENKSHGRSIVRKAGDLVFMESGEVHQVISKSLISENLNLELTSTFMQAYDLQEAKLSQSLLKHPFARQLLLHLYHEFLHHNHHLKATLPMLVLDLVGNQQKQASIEKRPSWISLIHQRLYDDLNCSPTLQELSRLTSVHPVNISKNFHKYIGCTLSAYIRRLRIERGIVLIKSSSLSLTEIALHCGFADQSHFTRTFQQLTGFLPSSFRRL